METVTQRRA